MILSDKNDYPTRLPRRVLRSAMFRSGLTKRLGQKYWRPTREAAYIQVLDRRTVEMFCGIPTTFADAHFTSMIGPDSASWSTFEESVSAIDDCWVEPNRCLVIGPDRSLVSLSVGSPFLPLFPSALDYALRGSGVGLREAVVFDGFQSTNYYHFLIERLPTILMLLDRSGLAPTVPLIVNRWIFESKFFAYLRSRSPEFRSLNWRVQEAGEWLRVKRAYVIQAAPFKREALAAGRAMFGRLADPAGKRIFLSRDPMLFGRGIQNERSASQLLGKYGFETVYAEHLTLEEQQRTFERATHLVALHGMGLVQQTFMDPGQGHVLELMPSDRLHSVYYWQGWTRGMRFYDVQTGSAMDASGRYRVDLDRLEAGVRRMLDHPAERRRYGETLITALPKE